MTLKPLNPYEGNMYAKLEGVSLKKVRHVTGAQALVELLKSRAAVLVLHASLPFQRLL